MKICTRCKKEKQLSEFGKNKYEKTGYRFQCKACRNEQLRTGKPNTGRFKKGCISLRKGCKLSPEQSEKLRLSNIGRIPWNKGKYKPGSRGSGIDRWAREVKEKDKYECRICGSKEKLEAHHIIPWKNDESFKYDINNGITVCRSCHLKIEPRRKLKEKI